MSIRSEYARLLNTGDLSKDKAQAAAINELARLESRIAQTRSLWRGLLGLKPKVTGLYLWGPPGRGKSMMMDFFFKHVRHPAKRRVHFHTFMIEVHSYIRLWRESPPKVRQQIFGTSKGDDPIVPTAKLIAKSSKLLCFDEFQVSDITDAVILGRLFEALLAQKVIFVMTSNRQPEELYKNGLNRELFMPFIAMIRTRLRVLEIQGPRDFRLDRLKATRIYFCPNNDPAEVKGFDDLWCEMTRLNTQMTAALSVNERKLSFERAAGPLLRADFFELCSNANGAADYLAIAERFTTVFIENIPILTPDKRNEAKRFVTLIDALYEANTKVVILADAEPAGLYPKGDGAFEFERTISRLEEMRSIEYLNRQH